MRSHGEQLWRFCYSLWESSMSRLLSLSASHTKQGCVRGTTPNTIEGIPQFGRLEMLIPVISNIWEWPFKKRLSVDLDWKRGMRCFWGRPVENLTADGKEKGCLRTDSNTRLEKYGFCGELFTTMAANNSSHHCTYVPPFLSSGEVYDSLSLIWSWLSELLWPKELGISDAVRLLGLGLKDLVAFVLILSEARWHLKRSGLFC